MTVQRASPHRAAMVDGLVTPLEFRSRLDPLLASVGVANGPIALAVSGGGDSMAMLVLAHAAYPGQVHAFTVDHGLRAESACEADQVRSWCYALGIRHSVLKWQSAKPATRVQERARHARYALLAAAAVGLGNQSSAAPLLTAHTLEDQAETFLLRLAHHSDLAGLAGMRAATEIDSVPPVPLLRPLLDVSRQQLRLVLKSQGQQWLEDPSNDNPSFERVRVRRLIPGLAAADVRAVALAQAANLFGRVGVALKGVAPETEPAAQGYVVWQPAQFQALPKPIGLRQLSLTLRAVGGGRYPPRGPSLEALHAKMSGAGFRGASLGGCQIAIERGRWLIVREYRPLAKQTLMRTPEEPILWDRRFWLRFPKAILGGLVTALGDQLARSESPSRDLSPKASRLVNRTLPGIRRADGRIEPLRIADNAADWMLSAEPCALFVGAERVGGGLCALWNKAQSARLASKARVKGSRNPFRPSYL